MNIYENKIQGATMLFKQGIWQKIQNFLQPTKQILTDLKNDPNIESVSLQSYGIYHRVLIKFKDKFSDENKTSKESNMSKVGDFIDEPIIIEDEVIINQFATTSSQLKHFIQQYQDAQLAANANISVEEFCVQIIEYMRELNNTLYDFSKYHKVQI